MHNSFLSLNAIEIAPNVNTINVYYSTTNFEYAIPVSFNILPLNTAINSETLYISFNKQEDPTEHFKVEVNNASPQLLSYFLCNCLYEELEQTNNVVLGEKYKHTFNLYVPICDDYSLITRTFWKYRLSVKDFFGRPLLFIYYRGKRNVSKSNLLDLLVNVEPEKMQCMLHKNKIWRWQSIAKQPSIDYNFLFPIINHCAEKRSANSFHATKCYNPYKIQRNKLLYLFHKYLLNLKNVELTGEDEILFCLPGFTLIDRLKKNVPLFTNLKFVNVSLISKNRKKKVSNQVFNSLIIELNKQSSQLKLGLLFHYKNSQNIQLKKESGPQYNLHYILAKTEQAAENTCWLIDNAINPETSKNIVCNFQTKSIKHAKSKRNFSKLSDFNPFEFEEMARGILSECQLPKAMVGTHPALIFGIAMICQEGNTKFGVSCVCTTDGIFIEPETFYEHQIDLLNQKIRYVVSLFQSRNVQPTSITFHLNTAMGSKNVHDIKAELSKIQSTLPMFFVEICPPARNTILGFDDGSQIRMPKNQTYVALGKNQYLLFVNYAYKMQDSTYPLPIRIKIESVQNNELNKKEIEVLLEQLFHFSQPAICLYKCNLLPSTILKAEKYAEELSPPITSF